MLADTARQLDGEPAALADRALDQQPPLVRLNDSVADSQPQPGSGDAAATKRALGRHKRLKDMIADFFGDAAAGIHHRQLGPVIQLAGHHRYYTALWPH